MKRRITKSGLHGLVLLCLSAGAAGCSTGSTTGPATRGDASTGSPRNMVDAHGPRAPVDSGFPKVPDVEHTYAPTYGAIYREVLTPNCAFEFCHGGSGLFMDLETKELGYQTLVNFRAAGVDCQSTGLMHVLPGKPEESLLYLKITTPPCGKKMPLMYVASGMLDPREIEQIRQWILRGAPDDGATPVSDAGPESGLDARTDRDL